VVGEASWGWAVRVSWWRAEVLGAAMLEDGRIFCVERWGGFFCAESGRKTVLYFLLRAGQVGRGGITGGGWSRW